MNVNYLQNLSLLLVGRMFLPYTSFTNANSAELNEGTTSAVRRDEMTGF